MGGVQRLATGVALLLFCLPLLSGCAALSHLAPKYQRDTVDDFYDKAMEIQEVFTDARKDLARIREKLVSMIDEGEYREAKKIVREAKATLKRMKQLPGKAKELFGHGQAMVTRAPTQYMGPQALHLPKKLGLLKDAIGALSSLGDEVTSIIEAGTAVVKCGSALVANGDRSPCQDQALAELGEPAADEEVEVAGLGYAETRPSSASNERLDSLRQRADNAHSSARGQGRQMFQISRQQKAKIEQLKVFAQESPGTFLEEQRQLLRRAAKAGDTAAMLRQLREALTVLPGATSLTPWAGLALVRLGRRPEGLAWLNHPAATERILKDAHEHYARKPLVRLQVKFENVPDNPDVTRLLEQSAAQTHDKYERLPSEFNEAPSEVQANVEWLLGQSGLSSPSLVNVHHKAEEQSVEWDLFFTSLDLAYPKLDVAVDLADFGLQPIEASVAQSSGPSMKLTVPVTRATLLDIEGVRPGDRVVAERVALRRIKSGAFILPSESTTVTVLRGAAKEQFNLNVQPGSRTKKTLSAFLTVRSSLSTASFAIDGALIPQRVQDGGRLVHVLAPGERVTLVAEAPGREPYSVTVTPKPGQSLTFQVNNLNLPLTQATRRQLSSRSLGRSLNWWGGLFAVGASVAGGLAIAETNAANEADAGFRGATGVNEMERLRDERNQAASLAGTLNTASLGAGLLGVGLLTWGTSLLLSTPEPDLAESATQGESPVSWTITPWLDGSTVGAGIALGGP